MRYSRAQQNKLRGSFGGTTRDGIPHGIFCARTADEQRTNKEENMPPAEASLEVHLLHHLVAEHLFIFFSSTTPRNGSFEAREGARMTQQQSRRKNSEQEQEAEQQAKGGQSMGGGA